MSVKCQTIISLIEQMAPKRLAEEWDNVGLHVGDPSTEVTGILVTLDADTGVVQEAAAKGANLIISHHPLLFKPVRNIRGDLPQGRLLLDLIARGIAVYCAHTNLDSAPGGVNQVLAELLELTDIEVLNPDKIERLYKIVVFIPTTHVEAVREAMTRAGAGWIGAYSDCTFAVEGTGTFMPREGCNPFLGKVGALEKVNEIRLETVLKEKQIDKVVSAVIKAHPYEEVAYDVYPLENSLPGQGLGRIGRLTFPVKFAHLMDRVKGKLGLNTVRFYGEPEALVQKVAVCGGSGGSFIQKASFAGADVYVTGDLKYHEAQEAAALGLSFVDAGHFATEHPIVPRLADFLKKSLADKGCQLPITISQHNKDIFRYY